MTPQEIQDQLKTNLNMLVLSIVRLNENRNLLTRYDTAIFSEFSKRIRKSLARNKPVRFTPHEVELARRRLALYVPQLTELLV